MAGLKAGKPTQVSSPLRLPLFAALALAAFTLLPRVHSNNRLAWTFWGASGALVVFLIVLRRGIARSGRALSYQFVPVKAHYVQLVMHTCIYVYWGWYWREVYSFAPLIVAQIVFAYALDMLVCWSRQDKWTLGFGPFPIVLSTNLFLFFRDDWFFLQFLMVATGVLCKEFIRWDREGRRVHIFNPSAIALFIFSIALLITHSTRVSWGEEIATTLARPPNMYLEIFVVGLVVQALFSVTLVTLSAAAALYALNLWYTGATGVYHFVDSNIPVSVFLGLHLLVTDPATSPRTTPGKLVFGAMYGASVFALYGLLGWLDAPRFYDKLLCVPPLNLTVRALDRAGRAWMARISLPGWLRAWSAPRLNYAHMGIWAGLFALMMGTGFLGWSHPGRNPEFWHRACDQGRLHGCREWVHAASVACKDNSAAACLTLGQALNEGRIVPRDAAEAAKAFGRACDLQLTAGCAGLRAFLHGGGGRDALVGSCDRGDGASCFILGSLAHAGDSMPRDDRLASEMFQRSCASGWWRGCGRLGESYLWGEGVPADQSKAIQNFEIACRGGHAPSCYNAALMYHRGMGAQKDEVLAQRRRHQACELGFAQACPAGQSPGPAAPASSPETNGRGGSAPSASTGRGGSGESAEGA